MYWAYIYIILTAKNMVYRSIPCMVVLKLFLGIFGFKKYPKFVMPIPGI